MKETELIAALSRELAVVLENYVPPPRWDQEAMYALEQSRAHLSANRKPIPDSVVKVLGRFLN